MTKSRLDLNEARRARETLKSGGGSGTFDPMEQRVAFLERTFEKMDGKLEAILSGISGLKGDVSTVQSDVSTLKDDVIVVRGDGFFKYFTP
ncbi:hypothetical protein [Phyllobacterium endophyticum]|uniref:hypothetical protein n=1 Tax=Phyllobacterium endophyticum TaxID=1149773 RepID=UPI0011C9E1BD|nr:hypothetical protein [Phyllobacterium endophyticum]TXR47520.1 hypothetical protein FVA77_19535 [Phyllobacterium endophyticum]